MRLCASSLKSSLSVNKVIGFIALLFVLLVSQYAHSATLTGVTIGPSSLIGGSTQVATGTVTIVREPWTDEHGYHPDDAAVSVSLSCANCYVSVPSSVAVATGNTSGTFQVSARNVVASSQMATVTATLGTSSSANVTVTPIGTSLSISPATLVGGSTQTATGTVTLSAPLYVGLSVPLTCSSPCPPVSVPSSVAVAAGSSSGTFQISARNVVASSQMATVTATLGTSSSANVTVTPMVTSLSISPATLVGGSTQTATGTVTLSAPLYVGLSVPLTCSSPCPPVSVRSEERRVGKEC